MTIRELMDRVAGYDLEWEVSLPAWAEDAEIEMATLAGTDKNDGRPFMFRLPLEKLQRKKI